MFSKRIKSALTITLGKARTKAIEIFAISTLDFRPILLQRFAQVGFRDFARLIDWNTSILPPLPLSFDY